MLHRVMFRVLNRIIVPKSLLRYENYKQIIIRSLTLRRHAVNWMRSKKLDQINCHHELSTQQENISDIKNLFCKEISVEDIGKFVQVRGVIVSIKPGHFAILRDKTGSIRLVIEKNRLDLREWLGKLEKYSFVKLVGIVKKKSDKYNDSIVDKESFDVVIDYVISSSTLGNVRHKKIAAAQGSEIMTNHFEELSTVINVPIIERKPTEKIEVSGWIKCIDKQENSFVLSSSNGPVSVDFHVSIGNCSGEVQKLKLGDLVVVDGLIADGAMPGARSRTLKNMNEKVRISANLIRILKDEDFSELRVPDVNRYTIRTHNCGELNEIHVGQRVRLMGWVAYLRLNRFVILQDIYGFIQLTIPNEMEETLKKVTLESVISVEGIVCLRPPGNKNKDMTTGGIEIAVTHMTLINTAGTLPFYIKDLRPARSTQLEYRYLDMRQNPEARNNLRFRNDILHKMRRYLQERLGFLEIETPTLFSRTPGGAQEFVVPTRKKGEFYSLVQSPQQFKQLLMIGGIDRYFQIARCYRDEDTQKDRQPEFTQLDIEISFCDREGVIQLVEDIIKCVWPNDFNPIEFPFPRITYQEAMSSYGTDKPDMRFDWKIKDVTDVFKQAGKSCSAEINMETYMDFEDFTALTLVARKGKDAFTQIKPLAEELGVEKNCKIFAFNVSSEYKLNAILNKLFKPPVPKAFESLVNYKTGDVVFLGFGRKNNLFKSFGKLRTISARILEKWAISVYDKTKPFVFFWVVDFPLFEETDGVISSVHHPFTQPHPDDVKLLQTDKLKMRGLNYDLVLNGNEIGGGSIRIHDSDLQREVLENILKLDTSYFKHLLDALSYGAPIHGGFALGIDRFISVLRGTSSIVDVIAFPKYSTGRDPLTGAPKDILKEDKELYHLQ